MKKFLVLICLLSSASVAAVSEDTGIYLRQDVFDAKIEVLNSDMKLRDEKIFNEMRLINSKLETLNNRITESENNTSDRIEDLKTIVYWGLSILGLLIAFAAFAPSLGEFLRNLRKPSITREDVERIIEEYSARMIRATTPA